MPNIILPKTPEPSEKLALMRHDARFEIAADAETAVFAGANPRENAASKIPKLFMANKCAFNCAYCACRSSRDDKPVYFIPPRELARLACAAAKNSGCGVFVTSAIYKSPNYTQELLAETVRIMRAELHYIGFIHAKVMPGADPALIQLTGLYADRLSINIEVAKSESYGHIAKQKNKSNILTPMADISSQIAAAKYEHRAFASSQTTQLMAGSSNEDDRTIMTLSQAIYKKYSLKRVYYTAFQYNHDAKGYENENLAFTSTPSWRMTRLYQADRLLQLYGFSPEDVTPESCPNLEYDIDPKSGWALRHLDMYPIEVNTADFDALVRVPGIGVTCAKRIIETRHSCVVTHEVLKKLRVSLKKSIYFITCNGKYRGGNALFGTQLRELIGSGGEQLPFICETKSQAPQ